MIHKGRRGRSMGVAIIGGACMLELVADRGCSLAAGRVFKPDCTCTLATIVDVELSSMSGRLTSAAGGVVEL